MKSSLYNEKIIEKKVRLFDKIEKILNTNFIHEELDKSVIILFKEYLEMWELRIDMSYSHPGGIDMVTLGTNVSKDICDEIEKELAIYTADGHEYINEIMPSGSFGCVIFEFTNDDYINNGGIYYVMRKILHFLVYNNWANDILSAKAHREFKDNMMNLYRLFDEYQDRNVSMNHMLHLFTHMFIDKLFEDYELTITDNTNGGSVIIRMDNLSDNRNEYKFICNFNNPTVCDDLYFLYNLLMDINDRRMYYIYRGIIESLNLSYYNDNDDKSIKIEIEHVAATDNINFERLSYTTYGMITLNCECNKGIFKAVFDSKSTYDKPLDFHTRCREYANPLLLPHHVYCMIFEIGETINVLVNKYRESFVKGRYIGIDLSHDC